MKVWRINYNNYCCREIRSHTAKEEYFHGFKFYVFRVHDEVIELIDDRVVLNVVEEKQDENLGS